MSWLQIYVYLSAAADSGDSSPAGSGGEILVALPRPVCLRGDVPIVSLATQWVGKKIFSIASAGHQFYVLVSHINMPNSLKFYCLLSEIRMD